MRKNLVLLGMMGVGKTTLGKVFAHRYKLRFIDIDSRIEKENSMSINKKSNELTVCGWINKKGLFEKSSFFPKGTFRYRSDKSKFKTFTDLYEISNKDLFQVLSVDDLKIDHEVVLLTQKKFISLIDKGDFFSISGIATYYLTKIKGFFIFMQN